MSGEGLNLVASVQDGLRAAADPQKSEPMRAYMKSEMPFLGIPAGLRRRICRDVFRQHPPADATEWRTVALLLWREAQYREERYAALDLIGFGPYKRFRSPACMPMYEDMIVTGAWWDYVDALAVRNVGALLDDNAEKIAPILRAWATDGDVWKRRTAIVCQVLRRERTDRELLRQCIVPSIERKEFFLRKAIGWALRAYSLVDPAFVRTFVETNSARISALSRKEALRRITDE